jgi:hypothetical protein
MEYLVILRNLDAGQDIPPHAGLPPLHSSHHNNFQGDSSQTQIPVFFFSSKITLKGLYFHCPLVISAMK